MGDGPHKSADSGDGPPPVYLKGTYTEVDTSATLGTPSSCIDNARMRYWSVTAPSGNFCVSLTQTFTGYLVETLNDGIASLSAPELLSLYHNSDSILAACRVSSEDAKDTPGKGYCGPAAVHIIRQHERTGEYPRPSFTDPRYIKSLNATIGATQGALITARRNPTDDIGDRNTRNRLRTTLANMSRGLTPSKGKAIKTLNYDAYMPAEEFVLMNLITPPSLRLMLWIAIPSSPRSVITPFSNTWAMASDAVDSTHTHMSGSCTPVQLISAATSPHHVIMHNYHYSVYRGTPPSEEVLQCIAALEGMIIDALNRCNAGVRPMAKQEASVTSHASPSILMETDSLQDSDCICVPPPPPSVLLAGRTERTIRSVRSGHTEMGISVGSLAKIHKKWIDSQQPGVSDWVDNYIWTKRLLQIVIPYGEHDGSTIPATGYCSYLLVYWVYLRDVQQMRPCQITDRLDLTKKANRKLLATFLTLAEGMIRDLPTAVIEDPVILDRLKYTSHRLLHTTEDTMLDYTGQQNWMSTLHIQRIISTFSTAHLWITPVGQPSKLVLFATNKDTVSSSDGWSGADLYRLHATNDAHTFFSHEAMHFSVVSSPPRADDIVNCYTTLARLIKDMLRGSPISEWPDVDISLLSTPGLPVTPSLRRPKRAGIKQEDAPPIIPSVRHTIPMPDSDNDDDAGSDEDYNPADPFGTQSKKGTRSTKKQSGAARRQQSTAKKKAAPIRKSKGGRSVGLAAKVGGSRRAKTASSISLPVKSLPAITAVLVSTVTQSFQMPVRLRQTPDRYTDDTSASGRILARDHYSPPVITSPPLPHFSTSWDDSTADRVYIAPSRLPGAGQGAYAARTIGDNETIGLYKGGEHLTLRHVLRASHVSDYVWTDETRGIVRDAKDPKSCAARFINDAIDSDKDNCKFMVINDLVCLVAIRKIAANEELYASYGEIYWRHSRWSSLILEQARLVHEKPDSKVIWADLIKYKKWDEKHPNVPYVSTPRPLADPTAAPLDDVYIQDSVIKWDSKSRPVNLKIGTWNVNGVTAQCGPGLSKIIDFYRHSGIDILYLTDTRLTSHKADRVAKIIKAALPGHAVVRFPSTHYPGRIAGGSTLSMGGMLAIVCSQWEPYIANTQIDSSGLGLVGKITLSYNKGMNKIDIIGAYLPPRPGTNPGPLTIWARLTSYLAKSSQKLSPRAYTERVVERWMAGAAEAGRQVFVCGDLNGVLETKCSQRDIRPWVNSLNLTSPHMTFLRPEVEYHTFFRKDKGISRIDHVLHTPLPPDQSVVEVGMDNDVSLVHYFDHRPIWIGIHIAHVHSVTTKPPPALARPLPVEIPRKACHQLSQFILLTDTGRAAEQVALPHVKDMTPEQQSCALAALLRITIASASTACGIVTKNRLHRLCRKQRSSYKDGYSPIMRIFQESLHFFIRIRRLVNARRKSRRWSRDTYYTTLLQHIVPWRRRVQNFLDPGQDINKIGLKLCNPSFLLSALFSQITNTSLSEKITSLRKMLQGRARKELRLNVSAAVRSLEQTRLENKIGLMIRRLGDKERFVLELFSMNDPVHGRITNPVTIHENLTDANEEIYNVPTNLDPAAQSLQDDPLCWPRLLHGLGAEFDPLHADSTIPLPLQLDIKKVCRTKATAPLIAAMNAAMSEPITFETFEDAIKALKADKAPGPSMVTPNMIKAWSYDTLQYAYSLINGLWLAKHIPKWWSDHILCPAPKKSNDPVMENIRPIGLFEVIRKAWTGIIGARIHMVWDSHNILHHAQHGFRWRQGTDTAILKLVNALEGTRDGDHPRFCTLWDVRKAFDSVPRNLLRLAWSRLGVPPDIVSWLTGLDEDGLTFVKSPHMTNRLEPRSLKDIKDKDGHFIARDDLGFKAIRGIGQGDNLSTLSWIALFDILLCLCEDESIAYADDLINTCHTPTDVQSKADQVSAFCAFTGLEIAATKILAVLINADAANDSGHDPPQLIVRDWSWAPMEVPFNDALSSMKYLGVDIATTDNDIDSFVWCQNAVTRQLRHLTSRRATSECKLKLIQSQILPTILYRASKACWPLAKYILLDKLFSAAYRSILRLNMGFPGELLYAPREFAGLELPRFSDLAQLQKWGSIHRAMNLGGEPRRAATELLARVQEHEERGTCIATSFFGTSLAEWGRTAGLALHNTAPTIPRHRQDERIDIPLLQELLRLGPYQIPAEWEGGAKIFSDGSYTTEGLTPSSILDVQWNVRKTGSGGAGIIWLGAHDNWRNQRPRMLRILSDTSPTMGLNSYAFELMGLTIGSQMSENIPSHVDMVSDCKGAVMRIDESMKLHHRALGHRAKGIFCESVLRSHASDHEARRIAWTRSHPENNYPDDSYWAYDDWGIWLADAIAEGDWGKLDAIFGIDGYDKVELKVAQILDSVIVDGLWHWRTDDDAAIVITDDIMHHMHSIRISSYLKTRDQYRLQRGIVDTYWVDTAPQLPAQCAPKPKNLYDSIKITNRVWDKWITGRLLAKGKRGEEALTLCACPLCGEPDSQKHMFTECKHAILTPLREKAFDLQAACLLQLQADGVFQNGMQWMHARARRMMNLANGTRSPEVERLWLGTFTPATLDLILQEDVHRTFSTTQYSQYCKVITELTMIRSKVAEEMINARYHHYHDARRRARHVNRRLPPPRSRKQRKMEARAHNQKCIDNIFRPVRRSQRDIRRQLRYRVLQQRMRTIRATRERRPDNLPPVASTQHRIRLIPPRQSPAPHLIPPLHHKHTNTDTLDVLPGQAGGYMEEEAIPVRPRVRMRIVTFAEHVTYNEIDLDKSMPSCTHTVDRSMGTDTHVVRVPVRHRDG